MAAWIGINSTHLDSHCGDTGASTLAGALNGTITWAHNVNEEHEFVLDFGVSIAVSKIRFRSYVALLDPTVVDIYMNNTGAAPWGAAIVSGINTWRNTDDWVEQVASGTGRYMRVHITDTEDASNYIAIGVFPYAPIFDVYGDTACFDHPIMPYKCDDPECGLTYYITLSEDGK